jgi:hypothetical protein
VVRAESQRLQGVDVEQLFLVLVFVFGQVHTQLLFDGVADAVTLWLDDTTFVVIPRIESAPFVERLNDQRMLVGRRRVDDGPLM